VPFFATGAAPLKDSFSAVQALPTNVQLVSLSWWNETSLLLRLAHQFGIDEDADLSKPVEVNLGSLFVGRQIEALEERGLAGTISREEVLNRRITWKVDDEAPLPVVNDAPVSVPVITLGPLQIRTFFLRLATSETVLVV